MRAVAIVCTFGRAALAELLACVSRQTLQLPTLVWVDDAPSVRVQAPAGVEVMHGEAHARLGGVRRAAVEYARTRYELGPRDAVLVLDDDDFYATDHYQVTVDALYRGAEWTGALAFGLSVDGMPPEYVRGEGGCGQHATWGYRLGLYDRAGGYDAEAWQGLEDTALAYSMGWVHCRPHFVCTHVRRHHAGNLSIGARFDRTRQRQIEQSRELIAPHWSDECAAFEFWCATTPRQ